MPYVHRSGVSWVCSVHNVLYSTSQSAKHHPRHQPIFVLLWATIAVQRSRNCTVHPWVLYLIVPSCIPPTVFPFFPLSSFPTSDISVCLVSASCSASSYLHHSGLNCANHQASAGQRVSAFSLWLESARHDGNKTCTSRCTRPIKESVLNDESVQKLSKPCNRKPSVHACMVMYGDGTSRARKAELTVRCD